MQRRTVLGAAMAGLAVTFLPTSTLGACHAGSAAETALLHIAQARRKAGLPGLAVQAALSRMARLQTLHIEATGRTSHAGPDGIDPVGRARQAGYAGCILGEALAETHYGPAETVAFWLVHDATRDVLLDPEARDVGLFALERKDGRTWWDLVLGV